MVAVSLAVLTVTALFLKVRFWKLLLAYLGSASPDDKIHAPLKSQRLASCSPTSEALSWKYVVIIIAVL